MTYHLVTSFNNKLWQKFAHKTVGSFIQEYSGKPENDLEFIFWLDTDQDIQDFAAGLDLPDEFKFASLSSSPQYIDFSRKFGGNVPFNDRQIDPNKIPDGSKFRYNYMPFAKKVFSWALTYFNIPENDYLVWYDADIILDKRLTAEVLAQFHNDFNIAFLDRDFPWYAAETGFFILKRCPSVDLFVQIILQIYMSGFIFDMTEWHDGYVFKTALKLVNSPELKVLNLNPVVKERDVFERTMLADFMTHYKGNLKQSLRDDNQHAHPVDTAIEFDPTDQED